MFSLGRLSPLPLLSLSTAHPPALTGHHYPYVIALLSKFIEIRTAFGAQALVQAIPLRAARFIAVKNDVYVAAQNQIWRLVPVPIIDQVRRLASPP